jgi:hypothetical protein
MKKKGLSTISEMAVAYNTNDKASIGPKLQYYILLREARQQSIPGAGAKMKTHINETWSMPDRTYSWFPYFMMYLTSK